MVDINVKTLANSGSLIAMPYHVLRDKFYTEILGMSRWESYHLDPMFNITDLPDSREIRYIWQTKNTKLIKTLNADPFFEQKYLSNGIDEADIYKYFQFIAQLNPDLGLKLEVSKKVKMDKSVMSTDWTVSIHYFDSDIFKRIWFENDIFFQIEDENPGWKEYRLQRIFIIKLLTLFADFGILKTPEHKI